MDTNDTHGLIITSIVKGWIPTVYPFLSSSGILGTLSHTGIFCISSPSHFMTHNGSLVYLFPYAGALIVHVLTP